MPRQSASALSGDAVILIRQKNSGVAEARDAGVRRASGDLIAFLDGDDIWAPGKIAVSRRRNLLSNSRAHRIADRRAAMEPQHLPPAE
jgi:glycosyltransferase involved in cell wall biosynthesis